MFVFAPNRTFSETCRIADNQRFSVVFRALMDEAVREHDFNF